MIPTEQDLQQTAIELAHGAGRIIKEAHGSGVTGQREVELKSTIDLVTATDRAAEAHILEGLGKRYPDHAVLAEESGHLRTDGPFRWVIDPLDGTTNFAHGIPHIAVLIAVQRSLSDGRHETVVAVTLDPLRDELFVARRGAGATLNGEPIRVSSTSRLIAATLSTGFGYKRLFQTDDNHAEYCRLNLLTRGVRRLGSAGLDLAYVACGRLDGFWESDLNPWDLEAGVLLVREAGGLVTTLDGAERTDECSLIAAGPGLHGALTNALASAKDHPVNAREGLEAHLPEDLAQQLRRTLGHP